MTAHQWNFMYTAIQVMSDPKSGPVAKLANRFVDPKKLEYRTCFESQSSDALSSVTRHFLEGVLRSAEHEDSKIITTQGMKDCANKIKALPRLADPVTDEIRYEPLIRKLVDHALSLVEVSSDRKTLARQYHPSVLWLLKLFRTMVEDEWGFSYAERDSEGTEESDDVAWPYQKSLNDNGVTELCLALIANGIERSIVLESVRVLVTLMYREGGSMEVQAVIHRHLSSSKTNQLFFIKIRDMLDEVAAWAVICEQMPGTGEKPVEKTPEELLAATEDAEEEEEEEQEPETPEMVALTMLKLMCEGHYTANQDIIREQTTKENSVNLLDLLVEITSVYSKIRNRSSTITMGTTCDLILELIQGPCVQNQVHFALETELMECLNSLLRSEAHKNQDDEEETELKCIVVKIFKALTECQKKPSLVFERLMSAVHADSLTRHLKVPPPPIPLDQIRDEIERAEALDRQMKLEQTALTPLQVECLVLVQMLCDYNPDFPQEVRLSKSVMEKLGTQIVSVEVVWNEEIERRFFPVPDVCKHLTATTRQDLVEKVNRDNIMQKQQDFTRRARIIMCELEHQENLREYGLAGIFSRTNQNRMTWISFGVNCFINAISVWFLTIDPDNEMSICVPKLNGTGFVQTARCPLGVTNNITYLGAPQIYSDHTAEMVQSGLNIMQICCSAFTLVLYLCVRSPVVYKNMKEQQKASFFVAMAAVMHPFKGLTPYYIVYMIFAVLGFYASPLFNAFLLFDILVKNSTSRDVLIAVVKPIKQLTATMILAFITIFVFSFVYFLFYRGDFGWGECDTLGSCFLACVTYGLRTGGGIGEYMFAMNDQTSMWKAVDAAGGLSQEHMGNAYRNAFPGARFWFDMFFFLLVVIILLNIIFGIIIDNFAELRDQKKMRIIDTVDFCFICGIPRQKFEDQIAPLAFTEHIQTDHCMWNYVKFMVYIWHQDRDDDDGLEQYVRRQINKSDINWFPTGTSITMKSVKSAVNTQKFQSDLLVQMQKDMSANTERVSRESHLMNEMMLGKIATLAEAVERVSKCQELGRSKVTAV